MRRVIMELFCKGEMFAVSMCTKKSGFGSSRKHATTRIRREFAAKVKVLLEGEGDSKCINH